MAGSGPIAASGANSRSFLSLPLRPLFSSPGVAGGVEKTRFLSSSPPVALRPCRQYHPLLSSPLSRPSTPSPPRLPLPLPCHCLLPSTQCHLRLHRDTASSSPIAHFVFPRAAAAFSPPFSTAPFPFPVKPPPPSPTHLAHCRPQDLSCDSLENYCGFHRRH